MATTKDALRNSQQKFFALDLGDPERAIGSDESAMLIRLGLAAAEADGTLAAVGATYSRDNDRIYDSIFRRGARLVTFAGVLKHGVFPLGPLLDELLAAGEEGMGTAVEMEFAVVLGSDGGSAEMAVLQLRPLMAQESDGEVDVEAEPERPRLLAGPALGNGVVGDLRHVVYLHPSRVDFARSRELAQELGRLNARLAREHQAYILMGPGRWGTADPWLGVPVAWAEVSGARVIVELEPEGSLLEPSQGSHFFHNITSLRVGYFCVRMGAAGQRVDLDWLEDLPAADEIGPIRHVVLPSPAEARIDGRTGQGVVVR
jgi:hypothetical protein